MDNDPFHHNHEHIKKESSILYHHVKTIKREKNDNSDKEETNHHDK